MSEHVIMKLSSAMRDVLDRLADGARLRRISGASWSTEKPGVNGHQPAWRCTASTVAALERRGLIRAVEQDNRPWSEREFVLACETQTSSPSTTANGCLHEAIQKEAYFISLQRQDGDAYGHWLEAERRLLGRLSGVRT